jgi:hypothetical protein
MIGFETSAAEKDKKHRAYNRFPKEGTSKVINSKVSGRQVYMRDINHSESGNIAFHAS